MMLVFTGCVRSLLVRIRGSWLDRVVCDRSQAGLAGGCLLSPAAGRLPVSGAPCWQPESSVELCGLVLSAWSASAAPGLGEPLLLPSPWALAAAPSLGPARLSLSSLCL